MRHCQSATGRLRESKTQPDPGHMGRRAGLHKTEQDKREVPEAVLCRASDYSLVEKQIGQ